ncbi:MAG: hypothetical protein WAX69_06855, partial [Victivallales bacterium]
MKTRHFCFENGKYWKTEEELPPPGESEILVKTSKSLVSVGTETTVNTGKSDWKVGRHGYSNVGQVVEVGEKVTEFEIGNRVFSHRNHTDYYVSSPESCCRLPDEVGDSDGTYVALGCVAMHAIQRASPSFGQPVVVVGLGTVGQLTLQLARVAGAGRLIAVDIDLGRRGLSCELGADDAIFP